MTKHKTIELYTDGGSRGNPGPAGIGMHVRTKDKTLDKKYGEYIGETTNNDAEYQALVFGLKKIKSLVGKATAKGVCVECFLDSELIVKQLNHEYKIADATMQKHFITVWNLMLDFGSVTFTHVRREKNKVADSEVNRALDAHAAQSRQGHLI